MIVLDQKIDYKLIYKIAYSEEEIEISDDLKRRILNSRKVLEEKIKNNKTIYGVNTGFGKLYNVKVEELEKLQLNLVRSHAVGTGEELEREISRAILFLKLFNLSLGYSGIRYEVIERLIFFLNNKVYPVIPKYGSVGSSGDLVPLSHMALTLIGEGFVYLDKSFYPSLIAHKILEIEPLKLKEKEGLSLINGLEYSKSILSLSVYEFEKLMHQFITVFLFSAYAFESNKSHFDIKLSKLSKSEGFSTIINILYDFSKNLENKRIQDPYSFRTFPHIFSAVYDNFKYISQKLNEEINTPSDNPIVIEDEVISSGFFQGQQISFLSDFLNMNLIKMCHLSERITFQLLKEYNFLIPNPGINTGLMIMQVSQASLLNSMNFYPYSIDNLITSEFQEDIVSFSSNSALNLYENIKKAYYILSYHLIAAIQALYITNNFQKLPLKLSEIYHNLRFHKTNPLREIQEDRNFTQDIENAIYHLKNGNLLIYSLS
ncbi:MAG: aromatic amino acid ammonia-lyase [candidate division WOR-3 bacterium]|nr:aromatic amino acid ammonia-lyase [candidate division WOR-3 bacterium]MCX7947860.1 aromatic amino acid ammonia-lyase [candidate division WOR-3 bacterium]MDW8150682.1 aromatic amino acid ammonia-lyase [candidate division WOR-3 bacterium]